MKAKLPNRNMTSIATPNDVDDNALRPVRIKKNGPKTFILLPYFVSLPLVSAVGLLASETGISY